MERGGQKEGAGGSFQTEGCEPRGRAPSRCCPVTPHQGPWGLQEPSVLRAGPLPPEEPGMNRKIPARQRTGQGWRGTCTGCLGGRDAGGLSCAGHCTPQSTLAGRAAPRALREPGLPPQSHLPTCYPWVLNDGTVSSEGFCSARRLCFGLCQMKRPESCGWECS